MNKLANVPVNSLSPLFPVKLSQIHSCSVAGFIFCCMAFLPRSGAPKQQFQLQRLA